MRIEPRTGVFVTLEGIDGCGKSTQAGRLARAIAERLGPQAVLRTFEPGDWGGGAALRRLLLGEEVRDGRTELLLFLADRSGHLESVVTPALSESKVVICERYSDSTLAYQCWGRGLSLDLVKRFLECCHFIEPDVTVLLDLDPAEAERRLGRRGSPDRIESDGRSFMERVSAGYRELARLHPERIVKVDAARSEDEVAASVEAAICSRIPGWRGTA